MGKIKYYVPASCGIGEIYTRIWEPKGETRGVLLILHGMSEYSGRFGSFAEMATEQGIAVGAIDLAGHGKSTQVKGDFGKNGILNMVRDAKKLQLTMMEKYPDVPVFILGNSLGTALCRLLISRYEGVDGCILVSTMNHMPFTVTVAKICKVIALVKGKRYKSKVMQNLAFSPFLRKKEHKDSKFPEFWDLKTLLYQIRNIKLKVGDPFTLQSYADMFESIERATNPKWASSISEDNRFLLLSGAEDPVGNFGQSVRDLDVQLRKNGNSSVKSVLYPELAHEVLQGKQYAGPSKVIVDWVVEQIREIGESGATSEVGAVSKVNAVSDVNAVGGGRKSKAGKKA
ncbi:MAG: lysophospholipase [Bifidobacteriaceae bacterium]|jgi:alpha-beta hydrolase superfamily lysophospholipase|nr:lysophospholipase [Bifidobacteriaceae bacterium]